MPDGDSHRVFDGRNGWWAGPDSPAPIEALTSGNLDRYRLEALVAFPAGIKQAFSQWKVGRTAIDDRAVQIVQGSNDIVQAFYATSTVMLALIVCGFAISSTLRPRGEEDAGHLEVVLATALPRTRWLLAHVVMTSWPRRVSRLAGVP